MRWLRVPRLSLRWRLSLWYWWLWLRLRLLRSLWTLLSNVGLLPPLLMRRLPIVCQGTRILPAGRDQRPGHFFFATMLFANGGQHNCRRESGTVAGKRMCAPGWPSNDDYAMCPGS